MSAKHAPPSLFERGISRQRIADVRERFLQLNTERLLRTRAALQERQRILFDLIPLLFHVNHPSLPGYSSKDTPCGIDRFEPTPKLVERAQQYIASGFHYRPPEQHLIHSIFIMGSCGSIAQAEDSDLDVWLCHRNALPSEARKQLQEKAEHISQWAAELGLELHFFLMDNEQFRRGKRERLSAEGAGTSQHYLLLDEFYRSVVVVAGRYPIWWLVPPEEEENYDEYTALLHAQQHIGPDESINFGGVAAIPAGEFIGAGVWQLYKAIASPYKALLKLLLTEAYARHYPNVQPICLALKARVYNGECDADQLDPYILVYQRLEHYLSERGEKDRLELVRRAFYFKTGLHLSRPAASKQVERHQRMSALASQWHWQSETLLNLDTRHRWKLRRVRDEHRFLVAELTNSYRFLQDFAAHSRQSALINSEEMTLLGRKLYAAFERKRHKVEWLNPGIAPDLSEQQLYFHTLGFGNQRRWAVSASARHDFESGAVLKEDEHLSGLLCWCYCNGLVKENSRLRLSSRSQGVSEADLNRLATWLHAHLPKRLPAADPAQHAAFTRPKVPLYTLFCINLGQDSLSQLSSQGIGQHSSCYPVANVEMVVLNSWGEVSSMAFTGGEALLNTLHAYQQLTVAAASGSSPPKIDILCFNDPGERLARRLMGLAAGVQPCFENTEANTRYILKLADGFHILQQRNSELDVVNADSYSELIQCLERGQSRYSPLRMDRHCLPNSALASIIDTCRSDDCYIFVHLRATLVDIFLRDERGSLIYLPAESSAPDALIYQLLQFLQHSRKEQGLRHRVRLYKLIQHDGRWQSRPLQAPPAQQSPLYLEATAHARQRARPVFDVRWNNQQLYYRDEGAKLFTRLATQLVERYPKQRHFAIDRVNLGNKPPQQTTVYMRYKRYLEELIQREVDRLHTS